MHELSGVLLSISLAGTDVLLIAITGVDNPSPVPKLAFRLFRCCLCCCPSHAAGGLVTMRICFVVCAGQKSG